MLKLRQLKQTGQKRVSMNVEFNQLLAKALEEKDFDTFLENCNNIIYFLWNKFGLQRSLGNELLEDAVQQCKFVLLKKIPIIKTNGENIAGFVGTTCEFVLKNFKYKHTGIFINEVKFESENKEKEVDFDDYEFPYDDNLENFLDVQVVKEHLSTYKSKKFQKAIMYYLEGYTKKEISKMLGMFHVGLANAIDFFVFRVRKLLGEETIDEETYFKENIRPQFWTYVKDKTKRRKV